MNPVDEYVTPAIRSLVRPAGFTKRGRVFRRTAGDLHALIGITAVAHYAGVTPNERETDPVWGVPVDDSSEAQACAAAVAMAVAEDAVPTLQHLLRPGELLGEVVRKKNQRVLRHGGDWQIDALYLMIDDAPAEDLRDLIAPLVSRGYGTDLMDRVERWIQARDARR